ncbi:hypothetical protein BSLG_001154 [Batrachochytrium salamandrivorans]|nr:hypothetical protein BSLG_001154 [Batrachochytrium salamandrivorans]
MINFTPIQPLPTGSKWAKFCRDSGFIGKSITATDFDIWFNKVKAKPPERLILTNSRLHYTSSPRSAMVQISHPRKRTCSSSGYYQWWHTTCHDRNGRDTNSKTNELSKIVNRKEANVRVCLLTQPTQVNPRDTAATIPKRTHQSVSTVSSEALDAKASKPKRASAIAGRSESNNKLSDLHHSLPV